MITLLFQSLNNPLTTNALNSINAVLPYFPYAIGGAILFGVGLVIKKRMDMKKQTSTDQANMHDPLNFGYATANFYGSNSMNDSPNILNRIYLMATGKKNQTSNTAQVQATPSTVNPATGGIPGVFPPQPNTGLNIPPGYDILIVKKITADRAKALAVINQKSVDETIFNLVENYLNNKASGKKGGNNPSQAPQKTATQSIGNYLTGKSKEFGSGEGFWKQK